MGGGDLTVIATGVVPVADITATLPNPAEIQLGVATDITLKSDSAKAGQKTYWSLQKTECTQAGGTFSEVTLDTGDTQGEVEVVIKLNTTTVSGLALNDKAVLCLALASTGTGVAKTGGDLTVIATGVVPVADITATLPNPAEIQLGV